MQKQKKRTTSNQYNYIEKMLAWAVLLGTLLAAIKSIFISLDIDECYALAVGYRLATGERFFMDLWESHQLGSFFLAPFFKMFLCLTGSTDYVVIFCRILGTIGHALIGFYFYTTIRKRVSGFVGVLLFALHMNFLPKWLTLPEFELQQYWFILLAFAFMYRFFDGLHADEVRKRGYLMAAGVMLVFQMFSYPTLILLYPLYVIGIIVLEHQYRMGCKKDCYLDVLWFTLGALIPGLIFIGYLFSYMSFQEFMTYVSYIFQDESHTLVSTSDKWKIFGADFVKIIKNTIGYVVIAFFLHRLVGRKCKLFGQFVPTLIILLSLAQTFGCLFGNQNQFYMIWRFFVIGVCGLYLALQKEDKTAGCILWFAILPGFLTVLSVLIMTNMDINTSIAKMFISVVGCVLLLCILPTETNEKQELFKQNEGAIKFMLLCMLAGLFVCKLVQIRVSGCTETTVMAPLTKIANGPATGIYMLADEATVLEDDYRELTARLTKEDKLLYIGSENIVYLWTDAAVATPSTQGTNAYNQMFIDYYKVHPDKMPNVIVKDKELGQNPAYYNSTQNTILFDWIEKEFGYTECVETNYMTIYRK